MFSPRWFHRIQNFNRWSNPFYRARWFRERLRSRTFAVKPSVKSAPSSTNALGALRDLSVRDRTWDLKGVKLSEYNLAVRVGWKRSLLSWVSIEGWRLSKGEVFLVDLRFQSENQKCREIVARDTLSTWWYRKWIVLLIRIKKHFYQWKMITYQRCISSKIYLINII